MNLAVHPTQHAAFKIAGRDLSHIINRLDALMLVLKSCGGDACRHPWRQLHPAGKVGNLADALATGFDRFYENQPKVSFSSCEKGYIISAEGPQKFDVYGVEKRGWNGWNWDSGLWW